MLNQQQNIKNKLPVQYKSYIATNSIRVKLDGVFCLTILNQHDRLTM
jgi:hypothetical protein